MNARHELTLRTAHATCEIVIEPGSLARLGETVRRHAPTAQRTLLVVDDAIGETHGETAWKSLGAADFTTAMCRVVALEQKKTLAATEQLYEAMLDAGLERTSPVVALGGGLVCDVAGYAAATFQRGVPIVMAPTTLLAMVDASIGGKNGVNFGEYKNMIGTISQPAAIVSDPEALATLPERQVRCGMAECIKAALLRDESLLPGILALPEQVAASDWSSVGATIARCAALKVAIVEQDEREDNSASGGRALLNLGHTFAHALELIDSLDLMHGEAVAIGLCAAAAVARRLGRVDLALESHWRDVVQQAKLPTQLPRSVPVTRLLDIMRRDKKVRQGKHRLVLPAADGGVSVVDDVPENVIAVALVEIGAIS